MRGLIEQTIASASVTRSVAKIAETTEVTAAAKPAAAPEPRLARADAPTVVASAPAEKSEIVVQTPQPRTCLRARAAAGLGGADQSRQGEDHHGEGRQRADRLPVSTGDASPRRRPLHHRTSPGHSAPAEAPLPPPPGARPGILGVLPVEPHPSAVYQTASVTSTPATTESIAARTVQPRGPWIIQVGAFPKESEAKERLREAQTIGKTVLAKAEPFTERFVKGSTGVLPRPLRRIQPAHRRSGLQVLQAQRDRLHGGQELAVGAKTLGFDLSEPPGPSGGLFFATWFRNPRTRSAPVSKAAMRSG